MPSSALAFNVVDLPQSMTFADALGVFSADDIIGATVSDLEGNKNRTLSETEIKDFYYAASNMTVWRKTNPTPFRGVCVNFTIKEGARISYYFNSGIQVGRYGVDNYVCYMPAKEDAIKLSYLQSEFYDATDGIVGGSISNVCTTRDFLKLPEAEWAKTTVSYAAAKNLVPYEFTSLYGKNITRAQMAELVANAIVVTGNYASMDSYLSDKNIVYLKNNFEDCIGRDESIDQLYALGIVGGRTDTTFAPDAPVTRQEFAAFITRAAEQFMHISTNYKLSCADSYKIAPWAKFFVNWTADNGIMSVDDKNCFYPDDNISVEQALTAVGRLYDLIN